jgi:hypothetical protein
MTKPIVFDDRHVNWAVLFSATIPVFLGHSDPILMSGAFSKGLELILYLRLMRMALPLTDRYIISIY